VHYEQWEEVCAPERPNGHPFKEQDAGKEQRQTQTDTQVTPSQTRTR